VTPYNSGCEGRIPSRALRRGARWAADSKTVHGRDGIGVVIKIITRELCPSNRTKTCISKEIRTGDQEGLGIWLVLLVCGYAHSAVSGDSVGDVSSPPSQKLNSSPSPFSKPRQFPHSGNTDNPASKDVSYGASPLSPRESCLPAPRRAQPAVAEVAHWDGKWVRTKSGKLTAVDAVDVEVTGRSNNAATSHECPTPNELSSAWEGPNISSTMSVDQSPEWFEASESWRDDVLPNSLEYSDPQHSGLGSDGIGQSSQAYALSRVKASSPYTGGGSNTAGHSRKGNGPMAAAC